MGCIVPIQPENSIKSNLENTMNDMNITGNVTLNKEEIIIMFEANESDVEMLKTMLLLANKSRTLDTRQVVVIAMRSNKPYYSIVVNDTGTNLIDVRGPEWRIIDTISSFDFYGFINVDNNKIIFNGEYVGNESDFFNQLLSSSLIGFEYAPWTTKMIFLIGPLNITVPKSDVFSYLKGDVNEDDFIETLEISRNLNYNDQNILVDNESMFNGNCSNKDYAYKQYVKYYYEVTGMMNAQNNGQTINQTKLNESYAKYKYWRDCYNSLNH